MARRTAEQIRTDRAKAAKAEADAEAARKRAENVKPRVIASESTSDTHVTRGARARRAYGAYQSHARAMRNAGNRAAAQIPGTDTFGTVFKLLSIAGLIGLGVLHPQAVNGVLSKAVTTIRTVITGGI